MRRIYFTAVPLDSNFTLQPRAIDGANFELKDTGPRLYPITRIVEQTMQPEDECIVVAVRQTNSDHAPNFDNLCKELQSLGLPNCRVESLALEESQSKDVVLGMFRRMLDFLQPDSVYYACMTFGTKTYPLVLFSVLNYAAQMLDRTQIKGIYYQELTRKDGKPDKQKLYDMTVLFSLNSIVNTLGGSDDPTRGKAVELLLEGF